jgi:hypothetical protein
MDGGIIADALIDKDDADLLYDGLRVCLGGGAALRRRKISSGARTICALDSEGFEVLLSRAF